MNSSRQLKRFDSSTKSPIYSHFSETIAGSTTIRAFGKTKTFETESKTKMEVNNRANWYSFQGNRWLSLYLDLTGSLILLVVTIQFVFGKESTTEGEGAFSMKFWKIVQIPRKTFHLPVYFDSRQSD